jgi:dihydroneopterin aldolase
MVTVEILNIKMHGYHGIYDGEKNIGSPYEVSVKALYDEGKEGFEKLENTINYVSVFEIIQQKMKKPFPLLENLAQEIIDEIKQRWPFAVEIMVSVYKLEPPIENFQGRVGVTIHKRF